MPRKSTREVGKCIAGKCRSRKRARLNSCEMTVNFVGKMGSEIVDDLPWKVAGPGSIGSFPVKVPSRWSWSTKAGNWIKGSRMFWYESVA